MREPQNVRYLAAHETMIARSVYIDTIPYGLVLISDGLGGGDRPFTVPTILPIHIPFYNFNVKGDGKYVIHAGDGYYGMSTLFKDKKTLIHELAHVWQGEHYKSWSWTYAVFSLKDQALSGDAAYAYDKTSPAPLGRLWTRAAGADRRRLVRRRNEDVRSHDGHGRSPVLLHQETYSGRARRWRLAHASHQTASGGKTGGQGVRVMALDGQLLPTLERPLRADDQAGIAARRRDIEDAFQRISPGFARDLISRLESRRPTTSWRSRFITACQRQSGRNCSTSSGPN